MPVPSRLDRYVETEKQKHFSRDFMIGWERYETWDEATVGRSGPAQRTFEITEEDILDYNRACGETDPLMVDPAFARQHSPTGELLQHPVFVTTIARRVSAPGYGHPAPAILSNASKLSNHSATAKSSPRRSRPPTSSRSAASPISRCCSTFGMRAASSRPAGGAR
jgi:hypothetical protein